MTNKTYPDAVKERGFVLYQEYGSLRAAHTALQKELPHKGPKKAPAWRTFRSWAKRGQWEARAAGIRARVEERTERTLADRRARRLAALEPVLDRKLALWQAAPEGVEDRVVPKLIELEDRLGGGGEKVDHDVHVHLHSALTPEKPAAKDEA